ncbi:MAG: DedA family protein [Thermoprotei archaeon]|jgi:membrane protein DedA with SNARE-associated domain
MSLVLWLANIIISFIETYGLLGIMITMTLESALIPLPSEVIMPFAGFVSWSKGSWLFFWQSVIVATLGNLLGSMMLYYAGAFGGRPLIIKYGKYLLISEKELRNAEEWFQKRGEITILIGRMMPAVRTVISLPAGIFRMHITKFVAFTIIGSIPWNIILAYFGYILGMHWIMILNYSVYIDIIGILALIVLIVIMFIKIKH